SAVRKPSRVTTGCSRCSMKRRTPASALTRVRMMSSPPGRSTRANSSSATSGFGTAVTTYCAITTSNELSGNSSFSASITASPSIFFKWASATRRFAFFSISSGISVADIRRIERQGNAGADADFEDAAAELVGRLDRGITALAEHAAEHEVVNRSPAVIGLLDHLAVDIERPGVV